MRSKFWRRYWQYLILFLIAGVVIALDQWTKALVRANLAPGEMWVPWDWLAPYARIVFWHNTGVAFGMFQGISSFFAFFNGIIALVILFFYPRVAQGYWLLQVALSLMLGGAVGNLIDRITLGYVTDFISVGTFAVWNIADASLVLSVGLILLAVWLQERGQNLPLDGQ